MRRLGIYVIFLRLPSEKYTIERKEFEYLKDLLVSLKLYFAIDEDSLCITTCSTIRYYKYIMILIVNKKDPNNQRILLN
jgi:hypothetical protein